MTYMTQIDKVLYDLVNTPFSRRIMVTMWNPQDLSAMNLELCAYSMTFNVTQKPGHEKLTLNAILNQRSQDMITAGNWNVCQVTEADYSEQGYVTTSKNASGTVAKTNPDAMFTNSRGEVVPTGIGYPFPWPIGIVLLAGTAYIIIKRRWKV